jgi:hypothetical protein
MIPPQLEVHNYEKKNKSKITYTTPLLSFPFYPPG